jgi:hypothetical protein
MHSIQIQLDTDTNQWRFATGSKEHRIWRSFGRRGHRYEAVVLLCLVEQTHGASLPLSALQELVRDLGQAQNLTSRQLSALFDSINSIGEVAGKDTATWAWRIVGTKTTGAWRLQVQRGVKIFLISNSQFPQSSKFLPVGLTADLYNWEEILYLLNQILSIDLALNVGDMSQAVVLCKALLQFAFSSPTARTLVQLKYARILIQLFQFADALAVLKECRTTTTCPVLAPLCKEAVSLLQARLRYDQSGATLAPSELQRQITTLQTPYPSVGTMEAERQNLLGLFHYRQARKCSDSTQRQGLNRSAIQHFHGALLLALTTSNYHSNYQQVQAFVYNLSQLVPNPIALLTFVCRVAEEMHIGGNSRNSQWALLSLCREMHKQEQKANSIADMDAALAYLKMPKPTSPEFWLELVERTQKTKNPHEIGNAYFLAKLGLERIRATEEARKMQHCLDALCAQDAHLARVLKADSEGWN